MVPNESKMRLTKLLLLHFSIISFGFKSHAQASRIEIVQPTIQQEASSIWRTINDYAFFEKQGYAINLPDDSLIDSLITKSKNGAFGNDDFSVIYTLLEAKFFDHKNYKQAKQKVENQINLLNDFIGKIDSEKSQWDWEFNTFDKYKVIFTLYGTGGSYEPDEGIIILLTDQEGGFMKYKNPAYTIIHEITHMGMEYSIVQKYSLTHALKERLVDTFVYLMFKEKLPEYKIQNMGDESIDKYLNKKKDIKSLNSIISEFVEE